MQNIKNFTFNGKRFTFVGETKRSRVGFSHIATLYENDVFVGIGRAHYTNRTWEAYPFQTVFMEAVEKAYKGRQLDAPTAHTLISALRAA